MATLQYRLSSRVAHGKAELLVRFYDGKFSQRAKTRIFVPAKAWNDKAGQLVLPNKITPESVSLRETQRVIDELTDYIYNAWWAYQYEAEEGWLQQTIDKFHNMPNKDKAAKAPARVRLADVVMEYAQSKDLSGSTMGQYRFIANALQQYEQSTKRPLYVDAFSENDVAKFVRFLTEDGTSRSRNTMSVKLKKLSAVCRYAVSKGYMDVSPFGDGKYKIQGEVYGEPVFLTIAERNALYACDKLPTDLAVQRDIFIFQCHVGCRVSDLLELTTDNLTDDGFIQYIQHKLRRENPTVIRVPLSDTALEIIARYKGQPRRRLLPFTNSQHYNRAIHDFCRIAGLKRMVLVQDPQTLKTVSRPLWEVATSHLARRTFMANVFKETKSEKITSAFTGHVNGSKAFSRYTSVDDEMKLEVLKNMHERNK